MASPDWWFDQFERDLANASDHGCDDLSNADYDRIAEGTTERFMDRMADEADYIRTVNKDKDT